MPELVARKHIGYYSDSDDDSSVPDMDVKGIAKAAHRNSKNRSRRTRRKKAEQEKKSKAKATQPRPKKSHKSKKRHGKMDDDDSDPSDSSNESSSDSSDSDDSSSSSSSSSNESSNSSSSSSSASSRKKKRASSKKSKKSRKKSAKVKKGKTNYHKFQQEDPSTGDSQLIYGMSINGVKIDGVVAPDSMRRKDRGSLYNASVDVTSLPGGWNSNKGVSEELFNESQKIAQLTSSTILASTNKVRGMEIQDTSWSSTIRHSLGKVKGREDLFEFVKKLQKSKKAAFKQECNLIQHYLYQPSYDGSYIREYCRSSLLGVLSARSFKNFFDLGDAIRQLAYDHPNWESGSYYGGSFLKNIGNRCARAVE
jgi:hypothetical protein